MKKGIIAYFLLLSFFVSAQTPEANFEAANAQYEAGNFAEALAQYEAVANEYTGFALWFNAGNAAYKSGNLGKSILYYERAKKINPTHDDLQINLAIANDKVADRIQSLPSMGVEDLWGAVTASTRLTTWATLAILFNLCGFLALALYLWTSSRTYKRVSFSVGVLLIVLGVGFYLLSRAGYSELKASEEAVILTPKVDIKTSPGDNGSDAFVLHEGTKCQIRQENGDWLEIKIANGQVGWIKKADIASI